VATAFGVALVLLQFSATDAVHASSGATAAAYDAFRAKYRTHQDPHWDSVSYETRLALFQQRVRAVEAHNARPDAIWVAEVNKFADYTPVEHKAMLGYRRVDTGVSAQEEAPSSSFLQVRSKFEADSIDWRRSAAKSSGFLREQGACGSCWAVAAVGAIEMHSEISGSPVTQLSYEQLVDCVPNPQHCGGDGGCQGATAELGFEYVSQNKLHLANHYEGYQEGVTSGCRPVRDSDVQFAQVGGFVKLAVNRVAPVLQVITTSGPVVASVDASGWSMYGNGIYNSCERNATVNHAVLLIGYGEGTARDGTAGQKYWLIRNSWGPSWGESGHIRLLKHDADEGEEGYCGWDNDPQKGVFCQDHPQRVPVCGMCGVLSDSSYPTGAKIVM